MNLEQGSRKGILSGVSNLRVVVADDHKLTLSGVADSLQAHGVHVVGRASSAPEAIEMVTSLTPDALMTDLDFGPGPTGLDVAQHVRNTLPQLGIVILSAYGDPRLHSDGLGSAPAGVVYVIKQQVESTTALVDALNLSMTRASQASRGELPQTNLTDRQIIVLRYLAQGMSNQAIAEELTITEDSVAKSINRMLKRLDIEAGPNANARALLIHHYFDLIGSRQ